MAIFRPIQAVFIDIFTVKDESLFGCDTVLIFVCIVYHCAESTNSEHSIMSQKTLIFIAVFEFSFQFVSDVMVVNMANILGMFV